MTSHVAGRAGLAGSAILALAAALTVLGVPLASAQGTTVFVRDAEAAIPVDDPWSDGWNRIAPVVVALSGQPAVVPTLTTPTITSLRVRAMRDDRQVSILVEWPDATRDESTLGTDLFADQVAVQFAAGDGISICMGQQAGAIDVWHWKADWAADLAGRLGITDANPNMPTDEIHPVVPAADASPAPGPPGFMTARDARNPRAEARRTSSVEDLNAEGFGSLTPQPPERQNVHGASEYRDGTWRVVFTRDLDAGDLSDALIDPRAATVVSLAVWDGSNGDRNGQKAVSTWLAMAFEPQPRGPLDDWPFLLVLALALGLSAAVLVIGAREPAEGHGWPASFLRQGPGTGVDPGDRAGGPEAPERVRPPDGGAAGA